VSAVFGFFMLLGFLGFPVAIVFYVLGFLRNADRAHTATREMNDRQKGGSR
jgi:hypothetical protein